MFKVKSFSVTQINQYIKRILSTDPLIRNISVEGEVSKFVRHSSGHAYFTLKDQESKIACVMFARNSDLLLVKPKNGDKIIARGQITVYERDGKYQLVVETIDLQGLGTLHIRFEALKKELDVLGFFSPIHKIPLPKFPNKIAVITSQTGAALQDIISVVKRRSAMTNLLIFPVHVQGEKAAPEICRAIERANQIESIDLIILARGGGSIEELWAFNERSVAESIFKSKKPIISAVGHETDFTISDFVSDKRAATPSAAAEIAIRSKSELNLMINKSLQAIHMAILKRVSLNKSHLEHLNANRICKSMKIGLKNPLNQMNYLESQINRLMKHRLDIETGKLSKFAAELTAYNPLSVLSRGYAMVYNDSKLITSVKQIEIKDVLTVHLNDGSFKATVEIIDNENQ